MTDGLGGDRTKLRHECGVPGSRMRAPRPRHHPANNELAITIRADVRVAGNGGFGLQRSPDLTRLCL